MVFDKHSYTRNSVAFSHAQKCDTIKYQNKRNRTLTLAALLTERSCKLASLRID